MRHIIIILIITTLGLSCKSLTDRENTIRKGNFDASIIETGELKAVNTNAIIAPNIDWKYGSQLKLTFLLDHGTKVKVGDKIAEIDKSSLMKTLLEFENRYEMEQTNLDKLIIQQNTQDQDIKSEISALEASYSMAKLQVDKFKFETEKKQKVKKLEFEKASVALQKARKRYESNQVTSGKTRQIQQIKLIQLKSTIADIKRNLDLLVIKSPFTGIMQLSINPEKGELFKVGDRIWPGLCIASVPNLDKMKVVAQINETDVSKIKIDQPVIVRLQAFPNVPFEATLTKTWPICYKKDNQSNVNVFDFEVMVKKSDPLLKPGMSVSCEVFYQKIKNVFYIENDCIVQKGDEHYIILEKGKELRKVHIGPKNNRFTVIYGDLKEGEKTITANDLQPTTN
jgi:Multidrug resistance efflux pump